MSWVVVVQLQSTLPGFITEYKYISYVNLTIYLKNLPNYQGYFSINMTTNTLEKAKNGNISKIC